MIYFNSRVRKFLIRNGIDVYESDIRAISKRLDIDKDGRISYSELRAFLLKGSNEVNRSVNIGTNYLTESTLRSTVRSGSPIRSPSRLETSVRTRLSPIRYTSPLRYRSPVRTSQMYSPNRSRYYSPKRMYSPVRSSSPRYEREERLPVTTEFKDYVKELIFLENELDRAKTDLALRSDFNVEHAFRQFEKGCSGYITDLDLKFGLKNFDVNVSLEEIKLIFNRYDLSDQGILK